MNDTPHSNDTTGAKDELSAATGIPAENAAENAAENGGPTGPTASEPPSPLGPIDLGAHRTTAEPFDYNPYGDPTAQTGIPAAPPPPSGAENNYAPPPPVYAPPPEPPKKSKSAMAALICGIIANVLNFMCCLGFPLGIAAIVCAVVDKSHTGKMSSTALAGLILGIVSLVLAIGAMLYVLVIFAIVGFSEGFAY